MTKLRWDKLAKRERDPGWAEERAETPAVVSPPSSPFSARRFGSASPSTRPSSSTLWRMANKALRSAPKQKGKSKRPKKTGATLPFDRYSLSVANAKQEQDERKAARKAAKKQRRAQRAAAAPLKLKSRAKPAPIPGAPEGQTSQPSRLKVDVVAARGDALLASWTSNPGVNRWKVTCFDSAGQPVRKSGLDSSVCELKIGGLGAAPQPLRLLVRGHAQNGQLVCEGVLDGLRLEG
jgi:hypothetical protein